MDLDQDLPPNHLMLALLSTILCTCPCGLVSLCYAVRVKSYISCTILIIFVFFFPEHNVNNTDLNILDRGISAICPFYPEFAE